PVACERTISPARTPREPSVATRADVVLAARSDAQLSSMRCGGSIVRDSSVVGEALFERWPSVAD
ncbi:MAG: hypothetical protein ACLQRM_19495, partial [Acidimicrobiales bacterium]